MLQNIIYIEKCLQLIINVFMYYVINRQCIKYEKEYLRTHFILTFRLFIQVVERY